MAGAAPVAVPAAGRAGSTTTLPTLQLGPSSCCDVVAESSLELTEEVVNDRPGADAHLAHASAVLADLERTRRQPRVETHGGGGCNYL